MAHRHPSSLHTWADTPPPWRLPVPPPQRFSQPTHGNPPMGQLPLPDSRVAGEGAGILCNIGVLVSCWKDGRLRWVRPTLSLTWQFYELALFFIFIYFSSGESILLRWVILSTVVYIMAAYQ